MTFILIVVGFFSSVRLVVQIMYAKKAIHQRVSWHLILVKHCNLSYFVRKEVTDSYHEIISNLLENAYFYISMHLVQIVSEGNKGEESTIG